MSEEEQEPTIKGKVFWGAVDQLGKDRGVVGETIVTAVTACGLLVAASAAGLYCAFRNVSEMVKGKSGKNL